MTDRVHPFTRVVGAIIIPFLVAAVVLLYPLADTTDKLFAWTIRPPITAMLLGSAYVGGIVFFVHVVRPNRWHAVRHGFPAVLLFATLLAVATFLHWDRFHFGHLSFIVWVTLYVTTPFLVLAAMIVNRGEDPGRAVAEPDTTLPRWLRILLALIGLCSLVVGLVLFVAPQLAISMWAWPLTPLTARVCGAILTLPGMVNVWMLGDARWSAFRQIFQAQLVSLAAILLALLLRGGELLWSRPSAPLLVCGLAGAFVVYLALYVWAERRRVTAAR
ncbi:hypothetical protein [Leifsonia shinshuensis]|uniref:hypothetical protein n=1 Tax=Leifsonia shinshuensis TaxID=150026 RepID=UPI002854F61D|nr:hypothetical protein [Leifsonia shinshuensis]MDR6970166.1 uncharacterized protein (DUF983 family) [Leifsonia shinshuensis]